MNEVYTDLESKKDKLRIFGKLKRKQKQGNVWRLRFKGKIIYSFTRYIEFQTSELTAIAEVIDENEYSCIKIKF